MNNRELIEKARRYPTTEFQMELAEALSAAEAKLGVARETLEDIGKWFPHPELKGIGGIAASLAQQAREALAKLGEKP